MTVTYDSCWPKRGKGYNSLTGVGVAMGAKTGKVLSYATRHKRCSTCSLAESKGKPAPEHDCRQNWCGSAKAMEADIAVQLAAEAKEEGTPFGVLVGDDDSSTIFHLRAEVDPSIEKWSDVVHATKSLGKRLYEIKKGHRELTEKNITHIQKCFAYALRQHANDASTLAKALHNIVAH